MFSKVDYVMVNVSDMRRSVAFYRDTLGLRLKFESPGWSEFKPAPQRSRCMAALGQRAARPRPRPAPWRGRVRWASRCRTSIAPMRSWASAEHAS